MFFGRKKKSGPKGLLLYSSIQDVITAHSVLQKHGLAVSLAPPPLEIAIGCDLAVQFELCEEEFVRGLMEKGAILPGKIHQAAHPLQPVENLTQICEVWPGYLMGVSNNIKVTIDAANHEIVNISGGGCPDIPCVAQSLIGKSLEECPEPMEIGTTLCAYMVQLAVDRLRREVAARC